jgi:hypothetical protein
MGGNFHIIFLLNLEEIDAIYLTEVEKVVPLYWKSL